MKNIYEQAFKESNKSLTDMLYIVRGVVVAILTTIAFAKHFLIGIFFLAFACAIIFLIDFMTSLIELKNERRR